MNHCFTLPAGIAAAAILALAPSARAQSGGPSIYVAQKTQNYLQTSSATPSADNNAQFVMGFTSPASGATFTPPGKAAVTPLFAADASDYEIYQAFSTMTALNAAFPSGTYSVSGGPVTSPVSFSFTGDLYPTAVPTVSGVGTWLPGGVLVLNPAVANTITLNSFSTYGSAGVASEMQINLNSDSPASLNGNFSQRVATQAVFGLTQSSTPFTSYTIPAGTLTTGGIYDITVNYNTLSSLDTTSIAGSGLISYYGTQTTVYVVANSSTTTTETAPAITLQPTSQTASIGGTATFSFGENYDGSTSVLFFFNGHGLDITSASKYFFDTSNSGLVQLTIKNVAATDAGTYYAVFVNPAGVVESASATLTTVVSPAPTVAVQPDEVILSPATSISVNQGSTLVLTTAAGSSPTPSFQWEFSSNGGTSWTPLSNAGGVAGAYGPQLVISAASSSNAGSYQCILSNGSGSVTTDAVPVTVSSSTSPGYLSAISARAQVLTGDNILIGGFYIVGDTSRTVLIQAIGPSLSLEGVSASTLLPDPNLTIHHTDPVTLKDEVLYSNIGWGGSPVLSAAAAGAYAQPTLPTNSADSELLLTLPPGGYTAEISGAAGTPTDTGVALCAIYELN
jgi:hypothetical protein